MTASIQRKLVLVIVLVLALCGLLTYGVLGRALGETTGPSEAYAAPAFTLDVLELGSSSSPVLERAGSDGRITLRELRGTPVVLNFWASWCEYCQAETPLLEATWKRAAAGGVVVLGVATSDVEDDARAFLEEYGVTFPTVLDEAEATADRYRATGLPATYFINARGEVVDEFIGELSADDLDAGIRAAGTTS